MLDSHSREMGDAMDIEVVSAIQLPDVERMRGFGVRMDPYCVLQSGKESVKTKRAHGGGRSPNWHQTVRLELQPGDQEIAVQVFNYSKLGTHDEVARAMVTIPSKYRQGDRPWEQRVAMQPVARAGKGALWGGEVFLRLRYAAPQEPEERRQTWPGQQYPSSIPNAVHQNGESSQGSFTVANGVEGASRMGSRFSKPFKHRATTDGAPQPLDASVHGVSLSSTEAGDSLGHSPRPAFSLHKAFDKVLRKVGARDKSHTTLHPPDTSVGTGATVSAGTSRRSSLGSLGMPEGCPLPEAVSSGEAPTSRHAIMPGWQEVGHVDNHLDAKKDSATQTESLHSQHTGKLSSAGLSGLSAAAPAASLHSMAESPSSVVAGPDQRLYKEPSFAVRDGQDLYHSPQKANAFVSCEPALAAEETASLQQLQQQPYGRVSAGTQTATLAISSTSNRPHRKTQEHAASWTLAGSPAPASPFANAQEDDFTFAGSLGAHLPGASSASTQPGSSPGQDSLFALRHNHSSASQQAQHAQQEQRQSSPMADSESTPRARRSLESADSAYTAMHAERQQAANALRSGTAAAAPSAEPPAQPALHVRARQEPAGDGASEVTGAYSAASSMVMSPVVGQEPKPQPSPFLQGEPSGHEAEEPAPLVQRPHPPKKQAPALVPAVLSPPKLRHRHSTGSGMQPLETSALQHGLRTMPNRIPPLPEIPSEEVEEANGREPNGDGGNAQEPAAQCAEEAAPSDGKGTGRVMRKTLSRKSPFLPEVLPSMINYEDITYCTENGQLVLLGEGSFGQVYKAQYLHCDVAVKKLNRTNDKRSDDAFRREAGLLKGCRNPYIVNFMGVCKDEAGRICLVTELMDMSLMTALAMPADENKQYQYYAEGKHILICIIKALIYLHAYNVAHLDIKSPNVLLKKGDAKVADVGLSQLLSRSFANSCSFGFGTFSWVATELLLGSHPVTTAADIFSFGVVMWEVCTLEQPQNRFMRKIEEHEAPPAILKLFHDCITENPDARPTAKQVLEVLMAN